MAYLSPDFDYDLFISYAQGDFGQVGDSLLKTWSQIFARELVDELRLSLEGKQVAVYRDEDKRSGFGIDPTRQLTEQLQQAVQASGLLVVLMSPFYLQSDWCKQEATWFVAEAERDQRGNGLLFVAHIWPTKADDWPPELKDENGDGLPGILFFDRKVAVERPRAVRPFGWTDPSRDDRDGAFRKALSDLVERAAGRLEAMRERYEQRRLEAAAERRLAEPSGQILYLYARSTHRRLWEQAYDELEQAGFAVMPSGPDPDPEQVGPEEEVKAAGRRIGLLKQCDALVLLRPQPGPYFDTDLANVGMRDRRSAREDGGAPMPCAVVDFTGVADHNDRQRRFAQNIRIEWIEGWQPGWPARVLAPR